jgi:hypothetical protein
VLLWFSDGSALVSGKPFPASTNVADLGPHIYFVPTSSSSGCEFFKGRIFQLYLVPGCGRHSVNKWRQLWIFCFPKEFHKTVKFLDFFLN